MSKEHKFNEKIIDALSNISIKFDELGFVPTTLNNKNYEYFVDWFKDEVKTIKDESSKQEKTISELEAKLAESEKSKESFKVMYFNKCLDYEHLHEKFDDKCAEFELKEYDYKQTIFEKDQDKISFALEQLTQAKEYIKKSLEDMWNTNAEMTCRDRNIIYGIYNKIDNQITDLKGNEDE